MRARVSLWIEVSRVVRYLSMIYIFDPHPEHLVHHPKPIKLKIQESEAPNESRLKLGSYHSFWRLKSNLPSQRLVRCAASCGHPLPSPCWLWHSWKVWRLTRVWLRQCLGPEDGRARAFFRVVFLMVKYRYTCYILQSSHLYIYIYVYSYIHSLLLKFYGNHMSHLWPSLSIFWRSSQLNSDGWTIMNILIFCWFHIDTGTGKNNQLIPAVNYNGIDQVWIGLLTDKMGLRQE